MLPVDQKSSRVSNIVLLCTVLFVAEGRFMLPASTSCGGRTPCAPYLLRSIQNSRHAIVRAVETRSAHADQGATVMVDSIDSIQLFLIAQSRTLPLSSSPLGKQKEWILYGVLQTFKHKDYYFFQL